MLSRYVFNLFVPQKVFDTPSSQKNISGNTGYNRND